MQSDAPTFTNDQQKEHRAAFIEECRQKAWGAACQAALVSKQLDEVFAEFTKLKQEDGTHEAEIKTLETAVDSHTKDNRDKRKALQERRNLLSKQMEAIGKNHAQGQIALRNLYQSVESNLELATYAETWEWKEAGSVPAKEMTDKNELAKDEQRPSD